MTVFHRPEANNRPRLQHRLSSMEMRKVLLRCHNSRMCPWRSLAPTPQGTVVWLETTHVRAITPFGVDKDSMTVPENALAQIRSTVGDAPKRTRSRLLHSSRSLLINLNNTVRNRQRLNTRPIECSSTDTFNIR